MKIFKQFLKERKGELVKKLEEYKRMSESDYIDSIIDNIDRITKTEYEKQIKKIIKQLKVLEKYDSTDIKSELYEELGIFGFDEARVVDVIDYLSDILNAYKIIQDFYDDEKYEE